MTNSSPQYHIKSLKISYIYALGSILIMGIKFWAYEITKSNSILSDSLESIVNVIAAILALNIIIYVSKPANSDYPYGHGKWEFFSSAFEGGLIIFAAVIIFGESIRSLLMGKPLHKLNQGLIIITIASFLNLFLGLYIKNAGKKLKSNLLIASGEHVLSDVITTFGIIIGLILIWVTKLKWIDSVIALIVAFLLTRSGLKIITHSFKNILDAEDKNLLLDLKNILDRNRQPGIIQTHHLRIIRSGNFHHIDIHVVIPRFWCVSEAHNNTKKFEQKIINEYKYDGEMAFHIDPCKDPYCKVCNLPNCNLRKEKFINFQKLTLEDLQNPQEPEIIDLVPTTFCRGNESK